MGIGRLRNRAHSKWREERVQQFATSIAFVYAALIPTSAALCEEQATKPQPLQCNIGPITKTYGLTQWLVYSCNDSRTVVIVPAPNNPAMLFYFTFTPGDSGYQLSAKARATRTPRRQHTANSNRFLRRRSPH
jgi:hypothetical protein